MAEDGASYKRPYIPKMKSEKRIASKNIIDINPCKENDEEKQKDLQIPSLDIQRRENYLKQIKQQRKERVLSACGIRRI
jgi:hypothetical protein